MSSIIFHTGVRKRRAVIRKADAARDARKYLKAALLYENALRLQPDDAAIQIQCGHMLKEAGELARAERYYLQAKELTPDDPDLALQLGHFYKVAGRLREAERYYSRAIELDPGWAEPAIQLAGLYRAGWRNSVNGRIGEWILPANPAVFPDAFDGVLPELAPQPPQSKLQNHAEEIAIKSLGRRERTRWGEIRNTLRGVSAIRGFCVSTVPVGEVRAALNGFRFCSAPLQGFPLRYEKDDPNKKKYVFNFWYDFSNFVEGIYDLELQFVDQNGANRTHNEPIVIAPPLTEDDYPNSDRVVSVSATDYRSLEEEINSRPSMVRRAKRTGLSIPPQNVLIVRVDQLGDMVVSIPAIRRLREFLPGARFVGLLGFGNVEFAKTLNIFDEVVVIDFPDDEWERRRVMPLEKQHELRRRLAPFKFDLAIDLAESPVSRPLLLLSGARFLVGFKDDQAPWLSAFYEGWMVDPLDGRQAVPISVKTLGLIEWLGALLGSPSQIMRRDDLARDLLEPFGLAAEDRFVVLHTGARLKFSQWPHYDQLAKMILDKTDLKVVMMTDDPFMRSRLSPELLGSHRFQFLDKRLPFDDFDAFLSFCTIFVGNDSGPSHLAALRGAHVINVFLARHNWNEWGHENGGYILTRRVPCAGCNIYDDPEECGKDFACITHISPEEVFRTLLEFV